MLPLDEKQVPMIRHLVAGAFAGLQPEHVSVIDLNGRTYSRGNSDTAGQRVGRSFCHSHERIPGHVRSTNPQRSELMFPA